MNVQRVWIKNKIVAVLCTQTNSQTKTTRKSFMKNCSSSSSSWAHQNKIKKQNNNMWIACLHSISIWDNETTLWKKWNSLSGGKISVLDFIHCFSCILPLFFFLLTFMLLFTFGFFSPDFVLFPVLSVIMIHFFFLLFIYWQLISKSLNFRIYVQKKRQQQQQQIMSKIKTKLKLQRKNFLFTPFFLFKNPRSEIL